MATVYVISTLKQRRIVNVETTLNLGWYQKQLRRQLTIQVKLWYSYISVEKSNYFSVETTTKNKRRINFYFKPNINVETTLVNVDGQHCFNVDFALVCLLGLVRRRMSQYYIPHIPYIPLLFYENKFIADLIENAELFNTLFAN